jgi:hypothetical protein
MVQEQLLIQFFFVPLFELLNPFVAKTKVEIGAASGNYVVLREQDFEAKIRNHQQFGFFSLLSRSLFVCLLILLFSRFICTIGRNKTAVCAKRGKVIHLVSN